VLIANGPGKALAYALFNLQERGRLFIGHGEEVYEGMIIGIHSRDNDLVVNPLKAKQLTNIRAAGTDENLLLTPPIRMSLEQALEFIDDDELVEVTPEPPSACARSCSRNTNARSSPSGFAWPAPSTPVGGLQAGRWPETTGRCAPRTPSWPASATTHGRHAPRRRVPPAHAPASAGFLRAAAERSGHARTRAAVGSPLPGTDARARAEPGPLRCWRCIGQGLAQPALTLANEAFHGMVRSPMRCARLDPPPGNTYSARLRRRV
jgi:hypothetical protein